MDFYTLMAGLTGGTSGASGASGKSSLSMILLMGGMFVVMYFVMIRPQKKKQKAEQEMRESVQVGDEITTIGGIFGRVVTVKEDSLVIETGADRNKIKIAKWAVSVNNTAQEKLEAERQAAKEAQEAEKQAKMEEARANSKFKRKKSKKDNDGADDE
ncbi:MAG: preprotein translocase subunit YajC [Firmicutes bacterium ADurb.Bin262]|mgnify:FL=1|nr:MAG: preprotein translocase subunit YajC [Firmicutes bacterium ADurb.Bin262]